jgi:AAA+ superfamily predicted ATPase
MTDDDFQDDFYDAIRADLVEHIRQNVRGKYTLTIRRLMEMFGYRAVQRLRQSSLSAVLEKLEEWGICASFPGYATALDRITLSLASSEDHVARSPTMLGEEKAEETQRADESLTIDPHANPFAFAFDTSDLTDRERSVAICHDIFTAIWSCQPVCLHIEAADEFFSFAAGFVSTMLRRRAAMIRRSTDWGLRDYLAPEILSIDELKRLQTPERDHGFPARGAVYLVQDVPEDIRDDELVAALRERCVPHTYRLKARFATTTADPGPGGHRAFDDPQFPNVCQWLCAFAGGPTLGAGGTDHFVDLASLLADAVRAGDALLQASAQREGDPSFRAGFESSEHMLLKHSMLRFLRRAYPADAIAVEARLYLTNDEDDEHEGEGHEPNTRELQARPDLCVGSRIAVEIETLRGLARPDTNAFIGLENKLRRKLRAFAGLMEVWLVVPSDVALLGAEHLACIVRNLDRSAGGPRLRLACVDLHQDLPVFLHHELLPRSMPAIRGTSWREIRKPAAEQKFTWKHVAGYSDLKDRIRRDVLEPLRDPEKYSRYGIGAPNGLLLYGLPGCGKSLIGKVLAGEADLACRMIAPSDLTSMWLGAGVGKIRALFDWALKQAPCLIIIDEFDALATQRREHNMHSDEKREVNELLAQLDRIADKRVAVVATTNYVTGIDTAVRRSGRFDVKIPVFPPTVDDRGEIFAHYLSAERLRGVLGLTALDARALAEATPLYTPIDIKVVVDTALRRAISRVEGDGSPQLSMEDLQDVLRHHQRTIQRDAAIGWILETRQELGPADRALMRLEAEVRQVYEV